MTTRSTALTVHLANVFQIAAHGAKGQVRKFSGLPYSTHPQAVLKILMEHAPSVTYDMQVATLLHDVVEDTEWTVEALAEQFGDDVANIVDGLTNRKTRWPDGTPRLKREAQKRVDAHRINLQPWEVKVIKLCDRLHNLPDIIENDPKHAKVYVPETRHLLDTALTGVHDVLWNKLDTICKEYEAKA